MQQLYYKFQKTRCNAIVKSLFNTSLGAMIIIFSIVFLFFVFTYSWHAINHYLIFNKILPSFDAGGGIEVEINLWITLEILFLLIIIICYYTIIESYRVVVNSISKINKDIEIFDNQLIEVVSKKD